MRDRPYTGKPLATPSFGRPICSNQAQGISTKADSGPIKSRPEGTFWL